jgi:hypothetical protein
MKRVGIYGVDEAIPPGERRSRAPGAPRSSAKERRRQGLSLDAWAPSAGAGSSLKRRNRTWAGKSCPGASDRGFSREREHQSRYNPEQLLRRRFVSERCRRHTSWQMIGDERRNML